LSSWAKFWAVDFHVHTPGSADAKPENYGTPDDIVDAALAADLDAIVITDHNTASWVDAVREAAKLTTLTVIPGVEISTAEGHLLALWEVDTPVSKINDLLVKLGIDSDDQGKLDVATEVGFADAAKKVAASGGLAIAAHIDKPRGLLSTLPVKAHLRKTLLAEELVAVEVVNLDRRQEVLTAVADARLIAFIQGSDTWDQAKSTHALSGIGARRTWIKAAQPDLVGIRHALSDPDLRVSLVAPTPVAYPVIERIELDGGFLGGQSVELCPDLNCLLGGTGAGKSLVLEAIRYCLDQQVDRQAFPHIADEVASRLYNCLGDTGVVTVHLKAGGERYRITRTHGTSSLPIVHQWAGDDWAQIDVRPVELVKLAAFSQGEILEYSREPVGRVSLIDAGLDLSELEASIDHARQALLRNGRQLLKARRSAQDLEIKAAKEAGLTDQVRALAGLFDTELVKRQETWKREAGRVKNVTDGVKVLEVPDLVAPKLSPDPFIPENSDLFDKIRATLEKLDGVLVSSTKAIDDAISEATTALGETQTKWNGRHAALKRQLDEELNKLGEGSTLTSLRSQLEHLQGQLLEATTAKQELTSTAKPALQQLLDEREAQIEALKDARHERRELRRARVTELNAKMAGAVRLDIPSHGDFAEFRSRLEVLKVGSRVRDDVLDAIAGTVHPFRFVKALWSGDIASLVSETDGIDTTSVAKFLANLDERDLWEQLLEDQLVDRPDVLTVKFKKPDDGTYVLVENLAHGQRCTAILVILLADGSTPVLVDQPEDALHAPWIETHLVERLRDLRGTRQYAFATRSPGLVVSADAEQILTMKATAGRGELEASGSLERHDLNKLVLHHLEGGPEPFKRRTKKLSSSI
jgi:hypothetical protein